MNSNYQPTAVLPVSTTRRSSPLVLSRPFASSKPSPPAGACLSALEDAYTDTRLGSHAEQGPVQVKADRMTVTPIGRFVLQELCGEFDAYCEREGRWSS